MPGLNPNQLAHLEGVINGSMGFLTVIEETAAQDEDLLLEIFHLCLVPTVDLASCPRIAELDLTETVENIREILIHNIPQNRKRSVGEESSVASMSRVEMGEQQARVLANLLEELAIASARLEQAEDDLVAGSSSGTQAPATSESTAPNPDLLAGPALADDMVDEEAQLLQRASEGPEFVTYTVPYRDIKGKEVGGVRLKNGTFILEEHIVVSHLDELSAAAHDIVTVGIADPKGRLGYSTTRSSTAQNATAIVAKEQQGLLGLTVYGPAKTKDVREYVRDSINKRIQKIYQSPTGKKAQEYIAVLLGIFDLDSADIEQKMVLATTLIESSSTFSGSDLRAYRFALRFAVAHCLDENKDGKDRALGYRYSGASNAQMNDVLMEQIGLNKEASTRKAAGNDRAYENIRTLHATRKSELEWLSLLSEGNFEKAEQVFKGLLGKPRFNLACKDRDGHDALYHVLSHRNMLSFSYVIQYAHVFDINEAAQCFKTSFPGIRYITGDTGLLKISALSGIFKQCFMPAIFNHFLHDELPFSALLEIKKYYKDLPFYQDQVLAAKSVIDEMLEVAVSCSGEIVSYITKEFFEKFYDFIDESAFYDDYIAETFEMYDDTIRQMTAMSSNRERTLENAAESFLSFYKRFGCEERFYAVCNEEVPAQPSGSAQNTPS